MPTREDIRAKLDEYDTLAESRVTKKAVRDQKVQAANDAADEAEVAQKDYRDAVAAESRCEDELEAMIVDHEPPVVD